MRATVDRIDRFGCIVTFRDALADTPRVSLNPSKRLPGSGPRARGKIEGIQRDGATSLIAPVVKGSQCCARLPSGGFPGAWSLEIRLSSSS
jgi:hypothetical protein